MNMRDFSRKILAKTRYFARMLGLAVLFLCVLPATSFAYDASSSYDCGNGGDFPMTFGGCKPGYYYEDWQNADTSLGPDDVGECLECPSGYTCAGGFAGPAMESPCAAGYYGQTIESCTACTNKPAHSTYTGPAATDACPWVCDSGYDESNGSCVACSANQILVNGVCQTEKFSVMTTNNTQEFGFYLSAAGTFYIDWGDGTTQVINRTNNTTYTKYEHTYASAGAYVVRFGGTATGYYNTDGDYLPTITFNEEAACWYDCEGNWSPNIASISGSLSALFPYIPGNAASGAQPRFSFTFYGATHLTSIPDTLFANYTTGANDMFAGTFYGCTSLATIPAGLFSGITTGANNMFRSTFYRCTSLATIPAGLFSGITTGADYMFYYTFYGCTSLATIPAGLFSGITTGANYMFRNTFQGCTSLATIPAGLFSGITTGANSMFYGTFQWCTSLAKIPAGLFSGITTGANNMFRNTFSGCTNLGRYIPPSTFAGLIANGHPTATNMWTNTFTNTNLATTCDAYTGMTQYTTGYENEWGGKVSCVDGSNHVCAAGEYLPISYDACTTCPENSYCPGGTYSFDTTMTQGIIACAAGLYAPAGMSSVEQCGRILHIGDNVVYLRSVKKTTPSLNFDTDLDGVPDFFGNMTTEDVPMTRGAERKLKIKYDDRIYSVYDDSVDVSE